MTRATNAPHHPAVRLDDVRIMAGNESQVHLALYRGAKPQCTHSGGECGGIGGVAVDEVLAAAIGGLIMIHVGDMGDHLR